MAQLETLKTQLGKPYFDLEFLLLCFKEVLIENNESELSNCIPWISESVDYSKTSFNKKHFHLFSVSFQLLNLAETNGAVQNRRKNEEKNSLNSINGLWASSLEILKKNGLGREILF